MCRCRLVEQYDLSFSDSSNSIIRINMKKCPLEKTQIEQPQILKNRHFYKPEQFIWNNPYRSSSRLYPYFHASNDRYQKTQAKLIDKLEQQDKENQEKERIAKLIKSRSKTRQLFKQRQETRQALEKKTCGVTEDTPAYSKTVKSIRFLSPSTTEIKAFDYLHCQTLKSIKTLKQLDQHLTELPLLQPSMTSCEGVSPRFKESLKKTGVNGKKIEVSFDLKKRGKKDQI